MELAKQEYPALLPGLEPQQAVDILEGRVALIHKIHADIADWLQERRRIEEHYATSLRKLARRPQQDNAAALGVFQMPWQRIVGATEVMAQSHETLAAKIQADVETPLRQFSSTNREAQSMGNVSGNLAAIAKEFSNAQKKAHKLDAKGGNKAGGARSNVDDATLQWESQSPFVFEQLQALDESRVNHLRDVLTQFQTHELDQVERSRASAESCLNALLNVETADEIKTFAIKTKAQLGAVNPARQDSTAGSSSLRPSGAVPPAPPPPRNANSEQRNSSIPGRDNSVPLPEHHKEKKLSGLKRFGTVMSRRKNAAPPPVPAEKKKERTRSFAPFRRQESSRSFNDLDSTGQDLAPQRSRDDRPSSRHEEPRAPRTQESLISNDPTPTVNGTSSNVQQPQTSASVAPSLPPLTANQAPLVPQPNTRSPVSAAPAPSTSSPDRSSRTDPFAQAQTESPISFEDSNRNFEIKDQPIPEDAKAAQLAMNNMANQLRMQAQSSGVNRVPGNVRGRRDVRNTVFMPNINQELPSNSATPDVDPSSTASPITAPPSATATSAPGSSELMTPVKRSLGTGTIPEDASHISDAHSIHSAHSAAGMAHHHELTSPGLNASIIETVNTWFSDTGVTRSSVIGEVALAYNSSDTTPERETVRVQNFHQLEKCAQNPAFVTPSTIEDSQPGTYDIALASITRPIPTVAFKYQLHLDESNLSAYSPIIITQAWQIIEGQANVILLYGLNPAFASVANSGSSSSSPHQLTLKNVAITVSLDTKPSASQDAQPPARAIGAQMMPVQNASFKKRSGAVVWRFPELTITQTQERLLVRFAIENNGIAKRGGVDVKFEAPNILGSDLGLERFVAVSAETADPFADQDGVGAEGTRKSGDEGGRWEDVTSRKVLMSGKYSISEQ